MALASYKTSHIVVSGGQDPQTFKTLASCEIYEIRANKWTKAPNMHFARKCHSSCSVGDYVYVACGQVEVHDDKSGRTQKILTNQIERLDLKSFVQGDKVTWELINISHELEGATRS